MSKRKNLDSKEVGLEIGLILGKSWAKVVVLIVSALNILNFPLGTALAIYAFWALTRPEPRPIT